MARNSDKVKQAVAAAKKNQKKTGVKQNNPFKPTEEQRALVFSLAQDGLSLEQIRYYIVDVNEKPIAMDTFRKYFQDNYQRGVAEVSQRVGASLVKIATSGKIHPATVRAAEIFLRCKSAWKEDAIDQRIELTGKDGGPVKHDHTIEAGERLAGILAGIRRAKAEGDTTSPGMVRHGETETDTA